MTRNIQTVLGVSLGACLLFAGCIPRKESYKQPNLPTPPSWQTGPSEQNTQAAPGLPAATDLKWKEFFSDEKLKNVVELALKNNRDLRVAALNVERARAQYRIQRAAQYPELDATGSITAYRIPAEASSTGASYIYESNQVAAQVSAWELDLFGRVRNLTKAQLELYLATEQGRASAQMALISSVAAQYLTLSSDIDSLHIAQSTLESQNATLELVRQARDRGVKSNLDFSQSLSQVQAAQVDVVKYNRLITLDQNALNVLVGVQVASDLMPSGLVPDNSIKDVAAGLPSDVLLHRPDILQAEHQLKSAYANIAAVRAAYFPRISLTVAGGTASGALSALFSNGSATWETIPQVTLPLFDMGKRRANYKIAQIDRDTYLAQYEKTVQTAFQEVSDSLTTRTRLLEQQEAQQALVNTLSETYRLSEARYKVGLDSYQNVLDAQRSLYTGQQGLVTVRLARLTNLVTLYKALGGGIQ